VLAASHHCAPYHHIAASDGATCSHSTSDPHHISNHCAFGTAPVYNVGPAPVLYALGFLRCWDVLFRWGLRAV